MTMGPEPMIITLFMSIRFGILSSPVFQESYFAGFTNAEKRN